MKKQNKGITLVALVITIIVLLILAGVAIGSLNNSNIFEKAEIAKEKYEEKQEKEILELALMETYMNTNGRGITKENLIKNLDEKFGVNGKYTISAGDAPWTIFLTSSNRSYKIDEKGKVTVLEKDQEIQYTLIYNLNGGTGNIIENKTVKAGESIILNDGTSLSKENYILQSWNTKVDGTGTDYELGATITVPGNITLYAKWLEIREGAVIPLGFYYVGGDLNSGVIISDNAEDKYEVEKDKTTYEYTTSLKGNQFIWIPCQTSQYKKTSWGKQNAEWDSTTPSAELLQIQKYGGFYVGRYEAGLASTITEFTTDQKHTGSNQIYNLDGVPQSKAGLIPWMFIDWTHAKANAERMYNNNCVSSGLITGTQWDVVLNTLIDKTDLTSTDMTDSSSWGNYTNTMLQYNGRLAVADYNKTNANSWSLKTFGKLTTGTTTQYTTSQYNNDKTYGDLLTTGASSTAEKYHIFDLAGNLWEWTQEDVKNANSGEYRVSRGGCYINASAVCGACYRGGVDTVNVSALHLGFRTVLYIK